MRNVLIAQKAGHPAGSRSLASVWRQLSIILLLLVLLTIVFSTAPRFLLGKCDLVGYALCHRFPDHSLQFAGRQLPLCARCSGMYLGALWGLLYLGVIQQRRADLLPRTSILSLLVLFFIIQGVDGVNSLLSLLPTLPHLYEPRNFLRFVTGALNGLTIAGLVLPLFNSALWLSPDHVSSIRGWREVSVLLMGVGGLAALISSQASFLLFVLGPGSILSVILVLTMLNTTILALVTGREGKAAKWAQAWPPLLLGLGLSLLEMGTLILLRGLVTNWLDFPI
jgi:uncharacterized membrane protein